MQVSESSETGKLNIFTLGTSYMIVYGCLSAISIISFLLNVTTMIVIFRMEKKVTYYRLILGQCLTSFAMFSVLVWMTVMQMMHTGINKLTISCKLCGVIFESCVVMTTLGHFVIAYDRYVVYSEKKKSRISRMSLGHFLFCWLIVICVSFVQYPIYDMQGNYQTLMVCGITSGILMTKIVATLAFQITVVLPAAITLFLVMQVRSILASRLRQLESDRMINQRQFEIRVKKEKLSVGRISFSIFQFLFLWVTFGVYRLAMAFLQNPPILLYRILNIFSIVLITVTQLFNVFISKEMRNLIYSFCTPCVPKPMMYNSGIP